MSLAQPWWLLLLVLIPAVIALHARRRRTVEVGSLFIWRQVAGATAASRPARSLPAVSLPLVLQILAVCLLALTLARPGPGGTGSPDHWLVLLDTSSGMRGFEDSLDLTGLLERYPDVPVTFAEVAGRPVLRSVRLTDRRLLPVSGPELTDEDPDWPAALRLLQGTALSGEETLLTVLATPASLRAAAALLPALFPDARVEYLSLTEDDANNRFQNVELQEIPGGWQVSGRVEADTVLSITFEPADGSRALSWSEIPTVDRSFNVALELSGAGDLSLLLPEDSFATDDSVRFSLLEEASPTSFEWSGQPDGQLERALLAAGAQAGPGTGVRLRVAAGPAADANLVFGADGEAVTEGLAPLHVHGHRLTHVIDFSGLELSQAVILPREPGDELLLSVPAGPLALLRETAGQVQVLIGFGPDDSNWTALPSFPAFVSAVLDLFDPGGGSRLGLNCVSGQACSVPAGAAITGPDGEPAEAEAAGLFRPRLTGRYLVGSRTVDVNLLGPQRQANGAAVPEASVQPARANWWHWLALTAAAVVLADLLLAALRRRRRAWLALSLQGAAAVLLAVAVLEPVLPLPARVPLDAFVMDQGNSAAPELTVQLAGTEEQLRAAPAALSDGLRLAAGLLPRGGTITVDGALPAADPDLPTVMTDLGAAGIRVSVVQAEPAGPEVAASSLSVPAQVHEGGPFTITAGIHAESSRTAEVALLRGGTLLEQRTVSLDAGHNAAEFTVSDVAGTWLYEFTVSSDGDTVQANNRYGSFIEVLPAPLIAVVSQQQAAAELFAGALRLQGLNAEVIRPVFLPRRVEELNGYGSIVLLDLPARDLHSSQQDALHDWVRDHGGGLLILGGANTFGPGGYWQTPIEELSPLSSLVDRESPQVALLFVLDRSGSMLEAVGETNRLEIAKAATLGAISVLDENSQVGIIMFDSSAEVLVPLQSAAEPEPFEAALATLSASGGTNIHPALQHAAAQLRDADASAMHVIVMTDGLSRPGDFPGVIREIRELGATLSTVAIGEGADAAGLANLARLGSGSTHATTDFRALPSILGQEALLLAGSSVEELTVQPQHRRPGNGPAFTFLETAAPLGGFVRTTAKDTASLHLSAVDPEGETVPLLATWNYGLGHVAAFASQGAGPWAEQWQRSGTYPAVWAQVVRWTAAAASPAGLTVHTELTGDSLKVDVIALDADLAPLTGLDLEAVLLGPSGLPADVSLLRQTGPGHYTAQLQVEGPGVHWLGVGSRQVDSAGVSPFELPVAVPYPQHLNSGNLRPDLLADLLFRSGGEQLDTVPDTVRRTTLWLKAASPLPFLVMAVLILMLALWWRYVRMP